MTKARGSLAASQAMSDSSTGTSVDDKEKLEKQAQQAHVKKYSECLLVQAYVLPL